MFNNEISLLERENTKNQEEIDYLEKEVINLNDQLNKLLDIYLIKLIPDFGCEKVSLLVDKFKGFKPKWYYFLPRIFLLFTNISENTLRNDFKNFLLENNFQVKNSPVELRHLYGDICCIKSSILQYKNIINLNNARIKNLKIIQYKNNTYNSLSIIKTV